MYIKILGTIAVLSFFSNILATMIGKGARECFHIKVAFACALIVITSALLFLITVILLLMALIWS